MLYANKWSIYQFTYSMIYIDLVCGQNDLQINVQFCAENWKVQQNCWNNANWSFRDLQCEVSFFGVRYKRNRSFVRNWLWILLEHKLGLCIMQNHWGTMHSAKVFRYEMNETMTLSFVAIDHWYHIVDMKRWNITWNVVFCRKISVRLKVH